MNLCDWLNQKKQQDRTENITNTFVFCENDKNDGSETEEVGSIKVISADSSINFLESGQA